MTARVSTRVQCSRAWTDFSSISTSFTCYLNSRLGYPEIRAGRVYSKNYADNIPAHVLGKNRGALEREMTAQICKLETFS